MADDSKKRTLERAQKLLRLAAPDSGTSEAERLSAALSAVELIAKNGFVVAEAPPPTRRRRKGAPPEQQTEPTPPQGPTVRYGNSTTAAAARAAAEHAAAYEAAYRAEYRTARPVRYRSEPEPEPSYYSSYDPANWTGVTIEHPTRCSVCGRPLGSGDDALYDGISGRYRCGDIGSCG